MRHLLLSAILSFALTGCALSETKCEGSLRGWHKFGGYCYLLQVGGDNRMSYYDAEDFCRSKGANLVSILSKEENTFLKETVASHTYYYGRMWIGLNTLDGPDKYQWSDGQPFNFQNIIYKQQYKKESCFILYGKEGGWRPEHCGLHYTPICKIADTGVEPTSLPPFTPDIPKGNCPAGWIQFGHRCYKHFGSNEADRLQFKEAKEACMSLGEKHDLVSIHSMEEQAFLTTYLPVFGTSPWIGFRYIENDQVGHDTVFGWTDNSRENFTYWGPGEPPRGTWKYCTYLNNEGFGKGQWMGDNCAIKKRGYICKRPPDVSAPKQPEPVSKCEKDSVGFMDSCYQYYSTPHTWNEAETICQNNGGHLLSINGAYEQNFLYRYIGANPASMWTGLKNVKGTRIFRWSSGFPLYYSNWAKSQPDIKDLQSSCVAATSANRILEWSVASCDARFPFICENTKAAPPEVPKDVTGKCPSSDLPWIDIGDNYCYQEGQVSQKSMQWGDNSRLCMSKGMEMISLRSEHQMKSLFSYLWQRQFNYWLGLIRSYDKESFVWIDSSSLSYTNWAENEPSAWSKSYEKDCVQIVMKDLKWNPEKCSDWSGSLCRVRKSLPGGSARFARSERSYGKTDEVAASASKEADQVSQSSDPVSLLIATVVCLGLSVLVAALVFAWKRRNEGELPTVMPVQITAESSTETNNTVPKY